MSYRLPAGIARVYRNPCPAPRFGGGHFWPWIAEIHGKLTYCESRESARAVVAEYRADRLAAIREGQRQQARANFYEANRPRA